MLLIFALSRPEQHPSSRVQTSKLWTPKQSTALAVNTHWKELEPLPFITGSPERTPELSFFRYTPVVVEGVHASKCGDSTDQSWKGPMSPRPISRRLQHLEWIERRGRGELRQPYLWHLLGPWGFGGHWCYKKLPSWQVHVTVGHMKRALFCTLERWER